MTVLELIEKLTYGWARRPWMRVVLSCPHCRRDFNVRDARTAGEPVEVVQVVGTERQNT